jgi:hypothetical protein
MAIQNTQLTTQVSDIYVSSANTVITTIHLCNYTNTPVQASVYAIPAGGTADNSTVIYGSVSISAYNTLIIYQEKFVLGVGDRIAANATSNSSVTATVSSIGI